MDKKRARLVRETNPNQASDGGAALAAFTTVLGHGFATSEAQCQVLAIASIKILRRSTAATTRLQHQIKRHYCCPH